ncbi:MAG: hypothetical protein RIB45_08660 [Marivibrio sp.]|uniref:hypothetical protein n=1 Tax=Marivibrio sp. TaxID=2039719 RepID=UPI0032EB6C16
MRLSLKIAAVLGLALAFGVGLTVFLSLAKVERTLEELVASRLAVAAQDLAHTVNGALALGLSVEEARNLPEALAAALAADDQILAIRIENAAGDAVLQAGASAPPNDALVAEAPLTTAFGAPAGRVALFGARAAVDRTVADLTRRMAALALAAVVAAALIGAVAAFGLLRGPIRLFAEAEGALRAMLAGRTPPVEPASAEAPAIEQDFTAFRAQARQAFVDIYQAERDAARTPSARTPPARKG